jgi:hypothetical protein
MQLMQAKALETQNIMENQTVKINLDLRYTKGLTKEGTLVTGSTYILSIDDVCRTSFTTLVQ